MYGYVQLISQQYLSNHLCYIVHKHYSRKHGLVTDEQIRREPAYKYNEYGEQTYRLPTLFLGIVYVGENGEDIEQNNYLAYVWYSVARLSGDRKAKSRLQELKSNFYPSQIAQAEEEAKRKFNAIKQRKSKK